MGFQLVRSTWNSSFFKKKKKRLGKRGSALNTDSTHILVETVVQGSFKHQNFTSSTSSRMTYPSSNNLERSSSSFPLGGKKVPPPPPPAPAPAVRYTLHLIRSEERVSERERWEGQKKKKVCRIESDGSAPVPPPRSEHFFPLLLLLSPRTLMHSPTF